MSRALRSGVGCRLDRKRHDRPVTPEVAEVIDAHEQATTARTTMAPMALDHTAATTNRDGTEPTSQFCKQTTVRGYEAGTSELARAGTRGHARHTSSIGFAGET
jgi:hypothetical protein